MLRKEVCARALRLELCANLMEGGTTPTTGMLKIIKSVVATPVFSIIRPRGGDFLYDDHEFAVMQENVKALKEAGSDGFVFGILCKDGSVDRKRCSNLLDLARPMPSTFHRAFDMCNDSVASLEMIIELGFQRVLTSGQDASALDGSPLIAKLIEQAKGRITIMPAGGISSSNLGRILSTTGAKEFHCSARSTVSSQMIYQQKNVFMGAALRPPEFFTKMCAVANCKELVSVFEKYLH
ncbi:copper homeostasis protein cutC homolog isoform X2 [Corticium candelabrum]|uniref:copper homeostasis protein cutC homolog isoform X2 n=1 Tax=Corticium candelabrum TaxID=121492 RepID=UPI002E25419A|nr:copper homeostasis protein cutC homolog isoform X2 [Corticium candelabrum]